MNNLPLFSFYKAPITNKVPSSSINILQLFKAIAGDYYSGITKTYRSTTDATKARLIKNNELDYITVSGLFTERSDSKIKSLSGYMVLDIDKQTNIDAIRTKLIQDEQLLPLLIFTSPSGNGLKVIIDIDIGYLQNSTSSKILLPVWSAVNCYLSETYRGIIMPDVKGNYIDSSGSDLSRACYLCHDKNCFINTKILKND